MSRVDNKPQLADVLGRKIMMRTRHPALKTVITGKLVMVYHESAEYLLGKYRIGYTTDEGSFDSFFDDASFIRFVHDVPLFEVDLEGAK